MRDNSQSKTSHRRALPLAEEHLVAAGFGQHQPLLDGKNEKDLARNRRIEFKLDQR